MKWDQISLGDIALQKGGSVDPKKHQDEVFELYSIPAFEIGTPEILSGSEIGSSKKSVQPDDVMVSRIVPHIRRAWVVGRENGHRQIASGEWIIFRSDRIWPQYLRWVLVGDVFHAAFMQTVSGVGGSLLRARPAEVYKIEIPLPPLPEQKRIAAILDAAYALRARRRTALAELDALLQSTFLAMFGDGIFGQEPWKVLTIGEQFELRNGVNFSADQRGQGILTIDVKNMYGDGLTVDTSSIYRVDIEPAEDQILQSGDILFVRSSVKREGVGWASAFQQQNERVTFCGFIIRARPLNELLKPAFLIYYLRQPHIRTQLISSAGQVAITNISQANLARLPIPIPPFDLQQRFTAVVESVDRQRVRMRSHLAELDALFASLQSRAFNGEL